MNHGYVYILTNPSMPGLVKIGRTSRDVDLRANELWQTGVPAKFEVYASEKTCDCVQLEAYVHGELRSHRLSKSREFFKIDPELACEKLRFWVEIQASEASQMFLEQNFGVGMIAVPPREYVSGSAIGRLADDLGEDSWDISAAIEFLTAEELAPALSRALNKKRQSQIEALERAGIPEEEWGGLING